MKFKVASFILALFALIGLGLASVYDFNSVTSLVMFIVLYVFVPAYGSYGTFSKNYIAISVTMLFFIFHSIRSVGSDSLLPNIAPITISFPLSDFSNGKGYLIDYFAIFMVIFLAWLLKATISVQKKSI